MVRRVDFIGSELNSEIVMGPACPFSAHSIGSRDGLIPRYSRSQACVRCVSAITEGRVSLDVHRIHRDWRRRFLEFWTFVEIGEPEECWPWRGPRDPNRANSGYHGLSRPWLSGRRRSKYGAARVAGWFTWGDFGKLPYTHSCDDASCCNPLHLRIQKVPHYFHNRRLDVINLRFDSRKLLDETLAFAELTRMRQPLRYRRMERINKQWLDYRLTEAERGPHSEPDQDVEELILERGLD
jgi:hypothetical protein